MKRTSILVLVFYLLVPSNLLGNFVISKSNHYYSRAKITESTKPREKDLELSKKLIHIIEQINNESTNLAPTVYDLSNSHHFSKLFPDYKEWINFLADTTKTTNTQILLKQCKDHINKAKENSNLLHLTKLYCTNALKSRRVTNDTNTSLNQSIALFLVSELGNLNKQYEVEYLIKNEFSHMESENLDSITEDIKLYNEEVLTNRSAYKEFYKKTSSIFYQLNGYKNNGSNYQKLLKSIFTQLEKKDIQNWRTVNDRLLSLAKSFSRRKMEAEAKQTLNFIIKNANQGHVEEAKYQDLWLSISKGDYKEAYFKVVAYKMLGQFKNHSSKTQFWISYIIENINKINKSKELYHKVIKHNPLSFYAIMSAKKLKQLGTSDQIIKNIYKKTYLKQGNEKLLSLSDLSPHSHRLLKRIQIWSLLEQYNLLKKDYAKLTSLESSKTVKKKELKKRESLAHLALASIHKTGNHLFAFKIIFNELKTKRLNINGYVLSKLFPKSFWQQITQQRHRLAPELIISVIRQESAFNPKASSHVGAKGLMQLMPSTAKGLKKGLSIAKLNSPVLNVKLGTKYLKLLLDKYENNLIYTLAAYNAGASRVNHWRKEYFAEDPNILHTIENIPFDETRMYVKLIIRNLFFYKLLGPNRSIADTDSLNKIFDIPIAL